jgi:ABC-type dipeptide/oligopeptide/nickel transport systems, permease components
MLFKKKDPSQLQYNSFSQQTLIKLRKDKVAIFAFVIIFLFTLIALLGYLITPDKTSYANQQYLELATKKPGFVATFLRVYDKPSYHKPSPIHTMAYGRENPYSSYPIYSHTIKGDTLYAECYTGDKPNNGLILKFPIKTTHYKIITQKYFLGTDRYGRDMLSELMIGSRVSLSVGLIAIFISLVIGITLGAIAGYFGGWIDNIIMWFINVVWSIPTILLVIAITFALGKGFWQVFVAVGLTMWVGVARCVRGQILSLKEKEFIQAAKALGLTRRRIIIHHLLPNVIAPVTVITASNFATAILQEAGLSFLGIGVQPPMPSWGTMIKENYGYIILDSAYMAILPGVAIMLLVLAFILLGSSLRKAMDVH